MRDKYKTKQQLIDELEEMRQRIAEMELSEAEHKLAREQLTSSAKRLGILFEYAPDAYYLSDLKGNFIDGNKVAEKITGYKKEELIGKSFLKLSLLSVKQISKVARLLAKNAMGKPTGPDEIYLKRKDGSQISLEIRTFPVSFDGQKFVLGIARDITERKKMEDALRQSEKRYHSLFSSMNEGFALHEIIYNESDKAVDYRILDVNPAYESITGIRREEAIGNMASDLYGTGEPPYIEIYSEVAASGCPTSFTTYFPAMDKYFNISIFSPGKGEFATVFSDISDQKITADELAKSEEKYRTIFDLSPEAIVILDKQGNILGMNGRLYDWLGYEAERSIGKNLLELPFLPEESKAIAIEKLSQRLSGKEITAYELDFISTDGERRFGRIAANPIRDEKGRIVQDLVMISDITEQKKTAMELHHRVQFEELITTISTRFINLASYDIDKGISQALQEIGQFAGVDRSYIFQLRDNGAKMDNTHEWCAQGIEAQIYNLQDVSMGSIPWWSKKLSQSEVIHIPHVADLPSEAAAEKEILQAQDIQSLVAVPMSSRGNIIGFVGFDSVLKEKRWSKELIALLRIIGEIFTNALERKHAEEELWKYRSRLEDLVEDRTNKLTKANEQLRQEILDRKQAEDALAAEKERLNVTLHSIGDGVITANEEGKLILMNRVAETLTGWTEPEAVGRPMQAVFHIIDQKTRQPCECPVKRVMNSNEIVDLCDDFSSDIILIARDGTERIISDSGAPIHSKSGKTLGAVIVFRDITEKRRMEADILKTEKLESIGILAGGIAHDFNNILTGILGNISLANALRDSDKLAERLFEAEKASIRARELTQKLLTFSHGGSPVKKTTDISILLRESANFALSGSNVTCHFHISPNLFPVEVDAGQMNQVISNLVINAVQAMPEGGVVEIEAKNIALTSGEIYLMKAGKYVQISIKDEGIGISKEHIHKIFDPYFSTKEKGSGLGLTTAYSIVKNHDGNILVESEIACGTTFHIYLPASRKIPWANQEIEDKPVKGKGKILLVDDEEPIRKIAGDMLASIGYSVEVAADGTEAIELYKRAKGSETPFDAVIVDLTIPGGMGGQEIIHELIAIDPEVKAIVSSGYSGNTIMADFGKYGFKGVITKPYTISELSKIMYGIIGTTEL